MTTDKQQQSVNTDDLDGTVFISDNLPFLKSLDTESIDLVCIDPPFGKTQTFEGTLNPPLSEEECRIEKELMESWDVYDAQTAYELGLEYPDQTGTTAKFDDIWSFRAMVYEETMNELERKCPAAYHLIQTTRRTHSDSIAAYITFMVERMLEIKRVLKPTGAVYLHCDHEANAYLRQMMDAVFGKDNFRNEIVWQSVTSTGRGSQYLPRKWGNVVNSIMFYAKSDTFRVRPYRELTEDEIKERFPNIDEHGRRYLDDTAHIFRSPAQGPRPNLCYEWRGFKNPHPAGWRLSKERLEEEYSKGNIVITPEGKLERRLYLDEYKGFPAGNLWTDIPPASGIERTGYPTQKPQTLAKRIIESSTEPGDIVLDCFAGCAYVPVAAQITNRRWIACDMSPRAWTVVRRQFHKHPELGIVTEGKIPSDKNGGLQVEPQLETANRIIKVRGPSELPQRTSIDEAIPMHVSGILTTIQYKQKPEETSQEIWNAFIQEWGPQCWYCGTEKIPDRRELHLDHVEPNKRDGTNDDCWNRAIACAICNSNKGDRLTPEETINLAFEQGLIKTEPLKREAIQKFRRRHNWARLRWETKIKPNRMI